MNHIIYIIIVFFTLSTIDSESVESISVKGT